jgi:hypothetical protein
MNMSLPLSFTPVTGRLLHIVNESAKLEPACLNLDKSWLLAIMKIVHIFMEIPIASEKNGRLTTHNNLGLSEDV